MSQHRPRDGLIPREGEGAGAGARVTDCEDLTGDLAGAGAGAGALTEADLAGAGLGAGDDELDW